MSQRSFTLPLRAASAALLAASAFIGTQGASAAGAMSEARANFESERARCMSGQSHQDRATCLREANNAYAEARRNRLSNGATEGSLQANALARCGAQQGSDRTSCEVRVRNGVASGSVEGGGVLREGTETVRVQ